MPMTRSDWEGVVILDASCWGGGNCPTRGKATRAARYNRIPFIVACLNMFRFALRYSDAMTRRQVMTLASGLPLIQAKLPGQSSENIGFRWRSGACIGRSAPE